MLRVGKFGFVVALACVACNAISGADKLGVSPTTDDAPIREQRPGEGTSTDDGGTGTIVADASTPPPVSDASVDAATSKPVTFLDTFDRANAAAVGNGWIEKTAGKFAIDANQVKQGAVVKADSYLNDLVRRPASEAVRDVQLAVDFTYGANPDSDPTLYTRTQPNSDAVDVLSGYTFYVYTNEAGFTREDGSTNVLLQSNSIQPALVAGTSYHFVFRVTGTDPVTLEATIQNADGSTVTSLSTTDNDAKRVTAAGQIGFGSSQAAQGRWDDFARTDL